MSDTLRDRIVRQIDRAIDEARHIYSETSADEPWQAIDAVQELIARNLRAIPDETPAEPEDREDADGLLPTPETQWGVRYNRDIFPRTYPMPSERHAREHAADFEFPPTVVRREVAYGPWTPATEDTAGGEGS